MNPSDESKPGTPAPSLPSTSPLDVAHEKIRTAEAKIAAAKESVRAVERRVESDKGNNTQSQQQALEFAQRELSLAYFAHELALKELDLFFSNAVRVGEKLDKPTGHSFHQSAEAVKAVVRIGNATKRKAVSGMSSQYARSAASFDDLEGPIKAVGKEPARAAEASGGPLDIVCWDYNAAHLKKSLLSSDGMTPVELAQVNAG